MQVICLLVENRILILMRVIFGSFYFSKTGEIEMIGNGDFEMVDILVVNSVGLGMCFILKISFKNKCQKKRYKYFFHFLYHLFCYVHAFSPHIPYNRKTERKHKKKEFLPSLLYIKPDEYPVLSVYITGHKQT